MKKIAIILILLLVVGAWGAKTAVDKSSKSSSELERFTENASNYGHDAELFLTEQAKKHHDAAFEASYVAFKLTPASELTLSATYDEKKYYQTLRELIGKEAEEAGQTDAYLALIAIGEHYGVDTAEKNTPTPKKKAAPKKDSALGSPKLGDKRTIPSSRRRDDD